MKKEEFRAWLQKHERSNNTVNTGTATLVRVESQMQELGSAHASLDDAYDDDRLEQLRSLIGNLLADAKQGGQHFRILMPDTTEPIKRLHGFGYWLRRYKEFRDSEAGYQASSDWSEFQADDSEEDPIVLFDGEGVAYVPALMVNQATGIEAYRIKPSGSSNRTEDYLEERDIVAVIRALLVDHIPVRIRPKAGGVANALTYPGKLVAYRLRPDIADELGLPIDGGTLPSTSANSVKQKLMPEPTNLILYGPPGTGKTYATAEEAVRLCDGTVPGERAETFARYRQLVEAGQIAFVTFHQSYAYEDFIEGLRPVAARGEDNAPSAGFQLEPRKGIFREICALAEQARKSGASAHYDLAGRQVFKMSLGRAGVEDHIYDAAIKGDYIALGWGGQVDWSDARYEDFRAVFDRWNQIEPGTNGNSGNIAQTWCFRNMGVGDLVVVSDGNSRFRAIGELTGSYQFDATGSHGYMHWRPVKWLAVFEESLPVDTIYTKPFTQQSCYRLSDSHIKHEGLARLLPGTAQSTDTPDQFVIVIDEINRANMSKVFGELITLIEPDKRLGMSGELKVKLPYSGDTFGVPANLHIIGTMNTADRSIALLDTALRRRFVFRELMPDPSQLKEASARCGIDLVSFLREINSRIEYLFDREHQIGHAYFMTCKSRADVDEVMRHRVIPLLAEYFFEDWRKIALVLGDAEGKGRFLERIALKAPAGFEDVEADERARWVVKSVFSEHAYDIAA